MVFVALMVTSCDGALCKIQRGRVVHASQVLAQPIEQAIFARARWAHDVDQAQFDGPSS